MAAAPLTSLLSHRRPSLSLVFGHRSIFSPTSESCHIRFQAALVLKLTISLSGAQKQCLSLFQQLRLLRKYLQVHRQQYVGWWAVNWTKLPLKPLC